MELLFQLGFQSDVYFIRSAAEDGKSVCGFFLGPFWGKTVVFPVRDKGGAYE